MVPSAGEKKPSKRRVPDSLRRRTLVSCDRCKTRRIRCSRTNENESCTNCLNGGVKCESTLPRKHRVYGSVESFSLRYRALDALVRGLFPNEDTDDVEVLFQLAKNHNIAMPSPDDQSLASEAFSHDQPAAPATPYADVSSTQSTNYEFPASEVVYERMIQGPQHVLNYVGPSSSSEFASIMRHMVTKYKTATSKSHGHGQDPQSKRPDLAPSQEEEEEEEEEEDDDDEQGTMGTDESSKQLFQVNLPSRKRLSQDSINGASQHLRDLLPKKALCDSLVQAYLENLHASFQVFYKPLFRLRYDSVWDNKVPQAGNSDVGWSCCLFMIVILGAEILGPEQCPDSIAIQTKYMKLIRDHFQRLAFNASLENVQALLLLQLYEHNSGERNTCWLVLGLAARMAITLGMHREGTYSSFDTTESQTRRIVWWTLFQYEYNISIIFGRPPTIDAREVNVLLPHDDVLDGPGYPKDFAEHYLALTNIGHRIRRLITTVISKYVNEQALLSYYPHIKMALEELEAWKAQLPQHLTPESQVLASRHRRVVLTLQAAYHHNKAVVTRPFLICKSNRNIDSLSQSGNHAINAVASTTDFLSRQCHTSAIALLDCFIQLSKYGLLDGVAWADFYYICHGNLALSLSALGQIRGSGQDLDDEMSKSKIAEISDIFDKIKLAPTYKIFTKVTIDLSQKVGLGKVKPPPPAEEVATQQVIQEQPQQQRPVPMPGFNFTNAPYGQIPWSATGTMPTMFPSTTDHTMLAPPGLLGWFYQEAHTGSQMSWDMFNLGNIQLTGAEYMEAPPQYTNMYMQQQQQHQHQHQNQQHHHQQQFEQWPGS